MRREIRAAEVCGQPGVRKGEWANKTSGLKNQIWDREGLIRRKDVKEEGVFPASARRRRW